MGKEVLLLEKGAFLFYLGQYEADNDSLAF